MSPSSYAATRIRFDNAIEVVTSARLQGRAIGGVADTLRLRAQFPDSYCDDALESYRAAETRANWRGRLRRLWADEGAPPIRFLSEGLAIPTLEAERMADAQAFGAAWAIAERTNPLLRRRLLRPSDLPGELAAAREGLSPPQVHALCDRRRRSDRSWQTLAFI